MIQRGGNPIRAAYPYDLLAQPTSRHTEGAFAGEENCKDPYIDMTLFCKSHVCSAGEAEES